MMVIRFILGIAIAGAFASAATASDTKLQRHVTQVATTSPPSQCTTIPPSPPPLGDHPRIASQARVWIHCYDGIFGAPCAEACVATVNNLVFKAVSQYLGGERDVNNTDFLRADGDVVALPKQSNAVPGDFMIVDSADGRNSHIGICLDFGCTDVISNSSSTCKFVFESAHNARFSYPGSPYIGGLARYYRAVMRRTTAPPVPPEHNAFGALTPLSEYATPSASVVRSVCLNKATDMKLGRWAYAKGHLLCETYDEFTGGQQLYTEVSPGSFVLSNAGGGTFRVDDLVEQSPAVSHNAVAQRPIDRATAQRLVNAVTSPIAK